MSFRLRAAGAAMALAGLLTAGVDAQDRSGVDEPGAQSATITVQLGGIDEDVAIEPAPDGSMRFVLTTHDGERIVLTPAEFARRVHDEQASRPWWGRVFNITSIAGLLWVGLGFLGQALFTGRMLVQWLASERERRSVVPVAFWWLSLVGASMLLGYFVWRKDIVGVLGQGTGWAIYVRNLWMLYRPHARAGESPEGARV